MEKVSSRTKEESKRTSDSSLINLTNLIKVTQLLATTILPTITTSHDTHLLYLADLSHTTRILTRLPCTAVNPLVNTDELPQRYHQPTLALACPNAPNITCLDFFELNSILKDANEQKQQFALNLLLTTSLELSFLVQMSSEKASFHSIKQYSSLFYILLIY